MKMIITSAWPWVSPALNFWSSVAIFLISVTAEIPPREKVIREWESLGGKWIWNIVSRWFELHYPTPIYRTLRRAYGWTPVLYFDGYMWFPAMFDDVWWSWALPRDARLFDNAIWRPFLFFFWGTYLCNLSLLIGKVEQVDAWSKLQWTFWFWVDSPKLYFNSSICHYNEFTIFLMCSRVFVTRPIQQN